MHYAIMADAEIDKYNPIAENSTKNGKSANCRMRIVILPQLDQFFPAAGAEELINDFL